MFLFGSRGERVFTFGTLTLPLVSFFWFFFHSRTGEFVNFLSPVPPFTEVYGFLQIYNFYGGDFQCHKKLSIH